MLALIFFLKIRMIHRLNTGNVILPSEKLLRNILKGTIIFHQSRN